LLRCNVALTRIFWEIGFVIIVAVARMGLKAGRIFMKAGQMGLKAGRM